ncbi:hypothetical protein [Duganella sp. Dugasp56]|uniref:hypothetical protein n=1 Tax=Duganella sp. Dugasp56 TaxID=3243046 RepID=UPI0039B05818
MQHSQKLTELPLFASDEVFRKAASTVSGIIALCADARKAGFHVDERWTWKTGSMNRHGVVRVESATGEVMHTGTWDTGSLRLPPAGFRITSRHGQCLFDALVFVRDRVLVQVG